MRRTEYVSQKQHCKSWLTTFGHYYSSKRTHVVDKANVLDIITALKQENVFVSKDEIMKDILRDYDPLSHANPGQYPTTAPHRRITM